MNFSEWITKKYIEWRGDAVGNKRSISDFARTIGISQPLLSKWMASDGSVPTSPKAINRLVDFFGDEVYEVLGLPVPGLSPKNSIVYVQASRELMREVRERDLDPEDPAFASLVSEVFERYGVKVQRTD